MDRIIEYPMEQIVVDDFLNQRVADMIALGKLISALLGTQTMVEGLACSPTSPASMDVRVAPGQIFFLEAVDTTTYGDLSPTANILGHNVAANAATIMKQGLILSETTFALTAPSTSGDSVNYLISAAYEDQDSVNTVLNYYNSSNPSQPFQGPNNSGTAQPILRQGKCVLSLTAGTAATTGTQQTPAVPSGHVGLYVITVANGQTSITASNISVYSGAPFLSQKLFNLMTQTGTLTLDNLDVTGTATIPPATASDQAVNLGQFPFSAGGDKTNGYVKFPNGIILQWGYLGTNGSSSGQVITYPIAFPNAMIISQVSDQSYGMNTGALVNLSRSQGTLYGGSTAGTYAPTSAGWIAVGW